ncbi:integrase core domain-containing protein [Bradyrhizobium sp. UNPF46]|uniref:integrase core domain-containing protein n=1 Tax=Bradyrhizobium sp. UNPF46 TaxID=1141168 RepID=UPI0015F111AF|nr:integrase core domain-containing protein [Bradyrhizobium sp. UNPF46]
MQYASIVYRERLADITISMSRPGNPFDDAKAESFMKTLKAEQINSKAFADLVDARRHINSFIAEVYNKERLHSALGYQSPIELETAFAQNKVRQPHCHCYYRVSLQGCSPPLSPQFMCSPRRPTRLHYAVAW